ncbi:uncharacterized protein PG998_002744 [Apiospora kogelbergensis]|uniref:uncharacterized protein n=1 Tax=Apiospora kogelbergensis TaxID=1337665 RepID=UPI00312CF940
MQALLPALVASPRGGFVVNVTSICSHFTTAGLGALGFNISALASNRLIETATKVYNSSAENRAEEKGPVFYSLHPGTVFTSPPRARLRSFTNWPRTMRACAVLFAFGWVAIDPVG